MLTVVRIIIRDSSCRWRMLAIDIILKLKFLSLLPILLWSRSSRSLWWSFHERVGISWHNKARFMDTFTGWRSNTGKRVKDASTTGGWAIILVYASVKKIQTYLMLRYKADHKWRYLVIVTWYARTCVHVHAMWWSPVLLTCPVYVSAAFNIKFCWVDGTRGWWLMTCCLRPLTPGDDGV